MELTTDCHPAIKKNNKHAVVSSYGSKDKWTTR